MKAATKAVPLSAPLPASPLRKAKEANVVALEMNRFLARAHDGMSRGRNTVTRSSKAHEDVNSTLSTTVRVQIWDGKEPLLPIIHLTLVPRSMPIFHSQPVKDRTIDEAERAARPLGAATVPIAARFDAIEFATDRVSLGSSAQRGPAGADAERSGAPAAYSATRRLDSLVRREQTALIDHLVNHADFVALYAHSQLKRAPDVAPFHTALKLRATPEDLRLFLMGKRVRPSRHKDVRSLMRLSGSKFNVGWSEVTLDLALNAEADAHLRSRYYTPSYSFVLRVDSVELAEPINDEAPFGQKPSTYVLLEHGSTRRATQIEHGTRAPDFEWESGPVRFQPSQALKIRVMLAASNAPRPDVDRVIGQVWLKPPVVPFATGLAYPAVRALSLGENVGVIHLSLRGPALRRRHVEGCVACRCPAWCCVPFVPCCAVPACCPSLGTVSRSAVRECFVCLTSKECKSCVVLLCCCCLAATKLAFDAAIPAR